MLRHQQNESLNANGNGNGSNSNIANNNVGETTAAVSVNPENDNVYVRELRRMFDSCASRGPKGENVLDEKGLDKLCSELHLQSHADYIIGQLIPSADVRLNFESFKIRFIQLLPEIVEFSTSVDETGNFVLKPEHPSNLERNTKPSVHRNAEIIEDNVLHSDNDTSNDILSEFSDDAAVNVKDRTKNRENTGLSQAENQIFVQENSPPLHKASLNGNSKSSPINSKPLGQLNSNNHINRRSVDAEEVEQILSELGLADKGYLGRYELRILCQHLGLKDLTPQELTILFNQLDKDGDGKISVSDFLSVCPAGPGFASCLFKTPGPPISCSSPIICYNSSPGINTSTNGHRKPLLNTSSTSLVLFSALDHAKTGHAKVSDLLQFWLNIGIEDGQTVLKKLGIVENHYVNLKTLCDSLFSRLNDLIDDDVLLTTAFYTLKAEILYLKETFEESRDQASFYLRELQQVNQRNSLLVEELDQSQQNLEIRSQLQLRELEDKYQGRISTLEAKYKSEREQWHNELRDRDELLHRMQQNEASLQSRLRQTDRENLKLKNEVDDLTQTVNDLEDINREIRIALQDASNARKNFSNSGHGKSERSKKSPSVNGGMVFNSSAYASKNRRVIVRNMNGPVSAPVVSKRPLRRKLLPHETSDFESDPEPYFMRPKSKRPLKKKQRLALVAHRMPVERMYGDQTASTSSSDELSCFEDKNVQSCSSNINGCCTNISAQLTALEKQLSEERKFLAHELRMEVTSLEDEHEREKKRIIEKYETEKRSLVANFRNQLDNLNLKHAKDKEDSLLFLENELRRKFDEEKRDMEIRWASERNVSERRFAEDKMAIMERLQNEFQLELKRIQFAKVSPANSLSDVSVSHSLNAADKQRLEKALNDKNHLESAVHSITQELENFRAKFNEESAEKCRLQRSLDECRANAEEKYKSSQQIFETTNEKLKTEICSLNDDARRLLSEIEELKKTLDAKISNKNVLCVEVQTENVLKMEPDDESPLLRKSLSKQSLNGSITFPDSAKMVNDMKMENLDLREKLTSASERVLELQSLLSITDSQRLRYAINERRPLEWTSSTESACDAESPMKSTEKRDSYTVTSECEKLKEENFLLSARLNEQRRLTEDLQQQLHAQMKETSKVALVAQNFYGKFCQLEESRENSTSLGEVKEAMSELYVEVAGRLLS